MPGKIPPKSPGKKPLGKKRTTAGQRGGRARKKELSKRLVGFASDVIGLSAVRDFKMRKALENVVEKYFFLLDMEKRIPEGKIEEHEERFFHEVQQVLYSDVLSENFIYALRKRMSEIKRGE